MSARIFPVVVDGAPRLVSLEEAKRLPREARGYVPAPLPPPVLRWEVTYLDGTTALVASTATAMTEYCERIKATATEAPAVVSEARER